MVNSATYLLTLYHIFGDEGQNLNGCIGKLLHKFNPNEDDWKSYVERLDQYFAANDITEAEKKRATLLSFVGAVTYKLIRNLTTLNGPTSSTYKDITELVQEHYNPKPSTIVERFKFNS